MKPEKQIKAAGKVLFLLIMLIPLFIYILGVILPKQPSSSMLKDSFWVNKIANEQQYDIVAVGDSRVYRGVNPEIISKRLNVTAFNFGFSSAGLDSILINNAVKLLNANGKRILLIGISPASFTDESLKNEHFHSLKKINVKDRWIQMNLYPYLTFFNNYSLSDLKKIYLNEKYFQTFYPNGFVFSHKIPLDTFEAVQPYIDFMIKNKVSQLAKADFYRLISNLHSKGIKVYGFRIPVSSPIEKIENDVFDFNLFQNEFEKANGQWITIPKYGLKSYDGSHLDGPSANRLSDILSEQIKKFANRKNGN